MRSPGSNIDLDMLVKLVRNRLNQIETQKKNTQILKVLKEQEKQAKQQKTNEEKQQEKEARKQEKLQKNQLKRNEKQLKKKQLNQEKKIMDTKKKEAKKIQLKEYLKIEVKHLQYAELPILKDLLKHYVSEGKLSKNEIPISFKKIEAAQLIGKAKGLTP